MDEPVDVGMEVEESPIDQPTQENYRIWKKNAPYLYDYISTTSLLWPSLSVQFFPDLETKTVDDHAKKDSLEVGVSSQRLLLGTFTLGQAVDNVSILKLPMYNDLNSKIDINKLNYAPDRKEFELNTITKKKLQVLQKINHYGDVNRARYMPQNPDLIASANNLGDLVIYDRTKHPNFKIGIDDSVVNKPEIRLRGDQTVNIDEQAGTVDIFAIDWNKQREGVLVSADMNGSVNIYDIKKDFKGKDQEYLASTSEFANGSGVNDIEWVPNHDSIFTTVDEEGWVKLYDTRTKDVSVVSNKLGDIGINSCSINPTNQSFIAIGDSIGQVKVFDLRMEAVVDELAQFDGSITQLKWHPKFHNILAGSAADNKVKIFNLQREDDKVLFVHGGHMLGVNDFDWCLHDDWLMTSVADDNSLHVWKPSSNIVSEYKQ